MSTRATGTFDVQLTPQAPETEGDKSLGRLTLDKQFNGDLVGTSKGQMLTGMTATEGSAGYVAIEKVEGTLDGRSGSFILQHRGIMDRGTPALLVTVVPDSGTDGLEGLAGSMTIEITGGEHRYTFDYTLPITP